MTQEVLSALIGVIGSVFAALIGAFGAWAAAEKKGQKPGCGTIGLFASIGGLVGLFIGLIVGVLIARWGQVPAPPPPSPTLTFTMIPTTVAQPSLFPPLSPPPPSPSPFSSPFPTPTLSPSPPLSQEPTDEAFCPPIGSPEAMFSIPLEEMGTPIGRAVGSGVFERAVRPFGTKPTPYRYVREALQDHPCVQYLTPSVLLNPSATRHCMTSFYHTNRIWMGSVLAGTSILVRKMNSDSYENIGQITTIAPDTRSYLVEYEIQAGDEICIEAPAGKVLGHIVQAGGYHLWIGRDLKIYTDSWCLMLENDNSTHWCQ